MTKIVKKAALHCSFNTLTSTIKGSIHFVALHK